MKIRANRDGRKTSLCEAYSSCCAYAFDSLQSLFTDNREVAAQEYKPQTMLFLARSCLGQVPGGAPFSQRSELNGGRGDDGEEVRRDLPQ